MSTSAKRPAAASAPATPPAVVKITLGVIVAILLAVVACTQMAQGTDAASGRSPADVLPAAFPVPDGAQVVDQGIREPGAGVVTLSVSGTAEDVVAFYDEQLPAAGWTTEPWEGTNPYGEATRGLILRKDGEEGALSATDGEDGRTTVQINLNQPVSPTESGGGMGAGH